MPIFQADYLIQFSQQVFQAIGVPAETAHRVSESLVKANLAGIDSHGVVRMPQYVKDIEAGRLDPKAKPEIIIDLPWAAIIDGHHGFGQVVAMHGIEIAIKKAKSNGIALVGLRRTNHIGRLGEYLLTAAKADMIGLGFCNGCTPNVAPFGTLQRIFGTNPIGCAVPVDNGNPILIDLATSLATEGKVRVARNKGEELESADMVCSAAGQATTNPNDFYEGGVLLPIGKHKGSALSLMIELLGGFLTGAGSPAFSDRDIGNGVLFIVFDPTPLREKGAFSSDIARLKQIIKNAKRAEGFEEVLIPGEPELQQENHRRERGISIDDQTWLELSNTAKRLGGML